MMRIYLGSYYFLATLMLVDVVSSIPRRNIHDTVNNRPIIGILTQEITPDLLPPTIKGNSYLAASYVKYIESAGGRVVPILTTIDEQELDEIFNGINGLLLPGGDAAIFTSKYYKNADAIYKRAVEANNKGDFFPIWGTCLGFQTLTSITAGTEIVTPSQAIDISMPLNFTQEAYDSRMLKAASKDLLMKLEKEALTYNYHYNCVSPETFNSHQKLKESFRVLSLNKDVVGRTFISTVEGIKYPFYGTQWHPEKNSFEWVKERHIAHSYDAVTAAQYFANFFVNEARKSNHKFASEKLEDKYLIYNYDPVFTASEGHFEQTYIF